MHSFLSFFRPVTVIAVAALLALSPAVAPSASAQESFGVTASQASALRERMASDGQLRVIVGVAVPAVPEGQLGAAERDSQRAGIAAAQNSIIGQVDAEDVVQRFRSVPYVTLQVSPAELERLINDPSVTSITIDQDVGPYLNRSTRRVGARRMWDRGIRGTGSAVAVLDTGITYRHRSVRDAHVAAACFSTTNDDPGARSLCRRGRQVHIAANAAIECPRSVTGCGHGTHVSSTVMGQAPRNLRGVAPDATLIPIQVFSRFPATYGPCNGTDCVRTYFSDQIEALEYVADIAAEHNIVAVNMSLGGGAYTNSLDCYYVSPAYNAVVNNLVSLGVAVIAASGNSGYNTAIGFPACLLSVIAVGATDDNDNIASFSSQAPGLVALMAPGVGINAARAWTRRGTVSFNGTSMATPHVAGAFALLRDAAPNATVAEMLAALQCTGVPVSRPNIGDVFPRINITAALRQIRRGDHPNC